MNGKLPQWQPFRQQACCQSCEIGGRDDFRCVAKSITMSEAQSFLTNLVAWRVEKGLSQEQVANILGVNKSTVHRWETGKRAVDLNDLNRLAHIYGVDPVALLLSPNDVNLARRLTEAKAILQRTSGEAGDRWLATGRDIAGSPEK